MKIGMKIRFTQTSDPSECRPSTSVIMRPVTPGYQCSMPAKSASSVPRTTM
jgi:hypothetical protein